MAPCKWLRLRNPLGQFGAHYFVCKLNCRAEEQTLGAASENASCRTIRCFKFKANVCFGLSCIIVWHSIIVRNKISKAISLIQMPNRQAYIHYRYRTAVRPMPRNFAHFHSSSGGRTYQPCSLHYLPGQFITLLQSILRARFCSWHRPGDQEAIHNGKCSFRHWHSAQRCKMQKEERGSFTFRVFVVSFINCIVENFTIRKIAKMAKQINLLKKMWWLGVWCGYFKDFSFRLRTFLHLM